MLRGRISAVATASLAIACGGSVAPAVHVPEAPSDQAKCRVAASQSAPLVTEWPASEKSRLESLTMRGGVVVAYSGCELRVLDTCSVGGAYEYQRTTLATDVIEITDEDELFAKLPLGAARLEGELSRSGRLAVRTTVVGQLRLSDATGAPKGGCSGATHVISGVAVGAFKLLAGGTSSAGGGAGVAVLGEAGAKASRSERTVREAGDPGACTEASEEGAPQNCRSPIQVFLSPLGGESTAAPTALPQDGPRPGTVQVALASHDPSAGWRLHDGNGTAVCDLPCERWIPRESNWELRRETGDGVQTIRLPDWDQPADRRVDAKLQPGRGSKALGIVGISLGGALIFSGLVWMLTEGVIAEEPNYLGPVLLTGSGAAVLTGGIAFTIYSRRDNWLEVQVSGARR